MPFYKHCSLTLQETSQTSKKFALVYILFDDVQISLTLLTGYSLLDTLRVNLLLITGPTTHDEPTTRY